ncbi:hypothetical protein OG455_15295 [Kitasatospora sp. NBC_01287]|uniref:hypothetical protein n=1 Tax=Kitasatospora sp. NBC_01287 TaxID=2903573 RepID=UPI0022561159|nr:hypothetical protein [Kitasatospora sp. NBC_01287]MCX4746870.1 hypothetical protein [Kitasatospora sp. NBC_01287]
MTIQMNTKLTGQAAVSACPRLSVFGGGTPGARPGGVTLSGVRGGLGLDATPLDLTGATGALRTSVLTGGGRGTSVETGLSLGWVSVADSSRVMRDERPTKAPKAVEAAAKHGAYLLVDGAGAAQKQDEQLINQAKVAFIGAEAVRIRAFRGPEPWRERT